MSSDLNSVNFWDLLNQKRAKLTKSGRIVAKYLTEHAEEAQYLSISSLAQECGVAEATIFRFCRSLGFDGYNGMRIALARAGSGQGVLYPDRPASGADTVTLCSHAAATFSAAISSTQAALDPAAVEKAALLLQQARQVYCMGQGGSMMLANDVWVRMTMFSNKFRTAGDSHMQLISASLMGPEDVILFISYSGATRDMMDTLRTAHAAGAKIILITHYSDSPGAALADVVLLCGGHENPLDSGSIPVKIAVLYVAEVLVLRYILDDRQSNALSQDSSSHVISLKLL
jgi:DNA-binding MurR/RpiR family transcriptional regulator